MSQVKETDFDLLKHWPIFQSISVHRLNISVCYGCVNQVPQTGGLKSRNVLSHSSRGQKFKIKMSQGLPPEHSVGRVCSRPLLGSQMIVSSLCFFTLSSSLYACLCVQISTFSEVYQLYWIKVLPNDFILSYLPL